jgi:putative ABC transport system substrate-binding protein
MPVIGFLHSSTPGPSAKRVEGFRKGLAEAGFIEGRNVAIEFRWASGPNDRLPAMAADLIRRGVAVIVTPATTQATLAAHAATKTIPIVFGIGSDPVAMGLVASLNRPGGNLTGISILNVELMAKRLGLLRELAPQAARFAVLVNPTSRLTPAIVKNLQEDARELGLKVDVLNARSESDIDAAFTTLSQQPGSALLLSPDEFIFSRRAQVIALAARYKIPTIYYSRELVEIGGLAGYGPDMPARFAQVGTYVGRILKGEKPADLPVVQSARMELVLNLRTAKALGLAIPDRAMALADEVIE